MSHMRYNYRRAKKFKLDDEFEVNDEFTGTAKRPLRGWKRWEYGGKIGNIYATYGNSFERFLLSSVGKRVDQVYSDFIDRMHGPFKTHADVRYDFRRKVAEVERIDGVLYDKNRNHNREYRSPLSYGEFYREPETGLLKLNEDGENWRMYRRHNRKKQPIMIDGTEYKKIRQYYKKRIAPGVFETESQDIWFKLIRRTYMVKEAVYVRSYDNKDTVPKWNRYGTTVFSHYKEVENEYFVKQTVSKEDIKKLKLESYEYDLSID